MYIACSVGNRWFVNYLLELRWTINTDAIAGAAAGGHLEMLRWLVGESRRRLAESATGEKSGDSAISGSGFFESGSSSASESNVGSSYYQFADAPQPVPMDLAAGYGHLHILEYLHNNAHLLSHLFNVPTDLNSTTNTATNSNSSNSNINSNNASIDTTEQSPLPLICTRNAMDIACANGHLEILQYLHTHRTEGCTQDALDYASEGGHVDIVQFLTEHRREGGTCCAMDFAAGYGHLKVVQYLHHFRSEGCSTDAMDSAAENGHLEVLEWLHAHRKEGCTDRAWKLAIRNGHMDVLWFLARKMWGDFVDGEGLIEMCAARGLVDVLRYLTEEKEREMEMEGGNEEE
jgi:hypothetical protein